MPGWRRASRGTGAAGYAGRPPRPPGLCETAQPPGGIRPILPLSQLSQEEDVMDRTSPDTLAFVALFGALLFWML